MKIFFPDSPICSTFRVGDRVRVDIFTLYKKPPYESIEGTIYQVRVAFPLLSTNQRSGHFDISTLTFRYGVQPDTALFPKMKDVENELYDLPEEYLTTCE